MPVSIIVLFVQVAGLKARLRQLEAAQAVAGPAGGTAFEAAPAAAAPLAPPPLPDEAAAPLPPTGQIVAPTPQTEESPAPEAPQTSQNRPLVLRRDRVAALGRWLRENWVYAVSAASLALAGIFFVQYGVERGLLPPGLRVLAALVFGGALVAAGEGLRRRHGDEGRAATAMLPSVFSGAGIVTLFAAVLAARQLYGLIGPQMAFAGHLATAALAVAIGWFSGPLLVAVGLVGAFAAPFVVGGDSTAIDWLYGYFALIAAIGLGVDAVRRWAWVSVLALVLGYGGGGLIAAGTGSAAGWLVQLLALVVLAATLPELRLIPAQAGPAPLPALLTRGKAGWPPFPVRLVLGAVLASALGLLWLTHGAAETALLAFAGLALMALGLLLWAERAEGLADMALWPALAGLAGLGLTAGHHAPIWQGFTAQAIALRPPETAPSLTASLVLGLATLVSLAAAYRALRPGSWGVPFGLAAGLVAPLTALVLELFWQPAAVLGPYSWALHVIGLAGLMVGFALRLARADAPQMRRAAHGALSALSLIALALFLVTTKTALTLALGALVVVASALDRRFRLPEMSLFLQAGASVLGYRLLVDPGLDWAFDAPLGQVVLAFGGPILAMLAAGWLLRPLDRPLARTVAESSAAGLAAILANLLITRWLDNGDLGRVESHWGLTLNSLPWLIFALMQAWRAAGGGALAGLRRGLAALGGLIALAGLAVAVTWANPLFTPSPDITAGLVQGPRVLDTLFLAYALPGLILMAAARWLPGLAPRLRLACLAMAAGLVALYAGLEIRRLWQGDWLGIPGVLQGELYSYTLAMMGLGAGLLYQAIARRSAGLRRLAMAMIGLTVAKVFLVDAAGLSGLTRVVSFAGLGLSLAALAWLNRWAGRAGDRGG